MIRFALRSAPPLLFALLALALTAPASAQDAPRSERGTLTPDQEPATSESGEEQRRTRRERRSARAEDVLPRAIREEDLRTREVQLAGRVAEVRTRSDLGQGFHPRYLFGTGAATWTQIPGGGAAWITAHAHLANADTVQIRLDDGWHRATIRYPSAMFDLALLVPEGPIDASERERFDRTTHSATWDPTRTRDPSNFEERGAIGDVPLAGSDDIALALAETWPTGAAVYSYLPQPDVSGPRAILFGLGERPRGDWSYYIRSLANVRNGHPVVAEDGSLVGITSVSAPDRHGGVFAISFEMIRAWMDEWPQLDDSAIGWQPRVIREEMQLDIGGDGRVFEDDQ